VSFLLFAPCSEVLNNIYFCAYSVLLAWTLSNGLLAAIITTTNDNGTANRAVNGYMAFLLFSVAGLACECWVISLLYGCWILLLPSVVRFVGSTTYMIVRLFAGEWKGVGREEVPFVTVTFTSLYCSWYVVFSLPLFVFLYKTIGLLHRWYLIW